MALHVLEDTQVEITALLLALLEVLGAELGAESNQEEHSVAAPLFADNSLAEVEVSDPNQLP